MVYAGGCDELVGNVCFPALLGHRQRGDLSAHLIAVPQYAYRLGCSGNLRPSRQYGGDTNVRSQAPDPNADDGPGIPGGSSSAPSVCRARHPAEIRTDSLGLAGNSGPTARAYLMMDTGASITAYNHFELGQPMITDYIWGRQVGENMINP